MGANEIWYCACFERHAPLGNNPGRSHTIALQAEHVRKMAALRPQGLEYRTSGMVIEGRLSFSEGRERMLSSPQTD